MFLRKSLHLFLCLAYTTTRAVSAPAASSCVSALQPSYPAPSLAPGYKAQLIATNLTKPRGLIVDSIGHLLVVQQGVGITSLRIDGHGNDCLKVSHGVDVVRNANLSHGIALSSDGKTLYASSAQAVFSWPSVSGAGNDVIAVTNKSGGDHTTRTLLFATKQKNTLIIKSFTVQKDITTTQNFHSTGKLLGWGLRNSVGAAEHPLTGGIYSVDMGMDYATRDGKDISENNPSDELNYHGITEKANDLDQGLNQGYPYSHAAWDVDAIPNKGDLVVGNQFLIGDVNHTFTKNDTINDAICARERAAPVITLPPHNAPIDRKFSADSTEAYISFHGSC